MNATELFTRFAASVQIAHHIPGRIRLKLAPVTLDDAERSTLAQAKGFQRVLDDIPGIRGIRLNPLARSCTVDYDASVIPPSAWGDLLEGVNSPAAGVLMTIIVDRYAEATRAQP
ncbi:cation transporter [Chitiniphilus eburneus]|uniref:Cation transporter n=1 Tax=Chitiniphilus eburneus TaxID=2571148 RepID=A0A4U0QSG2_9NEIS|nr:cation transporter [Chitiniphilus eburneus]TJZ79184.1 cation transporter [Chitiniphilus eburneus]